MKGLVLSGGEGTRLRPITHTRAKQLVPVANKPVLFYGLECLKACGITDVGIVVGGTKDEIKRAVSDGSAFGLKVTYVEQEAPLGIGHAVKICRAFVKDESFVVYLGDNLLLEGMEEALAQFRRERPHCQILLARVPDPNRFGVATVAKGQVVKLVEKPKEPESDLALTGVYIFDKSFFAAVEEIKPSARGELEITDAIQWLIDNGFRVGFRVVDGWWKDTGRLEDLLEANRLILATLSERIEGEVSETSRIDFRVVIEAGARVVNSSIRGPALIGRDSLVADSYVGPFTSIGNNCRLENCEVEHSILMDGSMIKNVRGRITDSLLGENCYLDRLQQKPRAYRFMLGDNSQVEVI